MAGLFKRLFERIKSYASRFSFRTGVIILIVCLLFYVLSFAQMLLPISATAKGVLWFIFFGMAKITQYLGLAIVGIEGWRKIKEKFKKS